jgi:asparagine synthase (glutamine-hydrolysing)
MSGIVGIVNLDGAPVDRELLARMTDFMSFRGPDAQQIWIDGYVGFGHTMLRTTFEAETEKQPLTLDGKVWLTADARIDGRAELIAELEGKLRRRLRLSVPSNGHGSSPNGHGFPSNGHGSDERVPNDSELILYAYEAWGEDCVTHLIGDFAFAIWDSRERHFFCARDHFGVKPFYYAHIGNTFIFSNTLNCVRQHPAVSDKLNDLAIADFLLFGINQDLSTTSFRHISRLPAASHLRAANGTLRVDLYWAAPREGHKDYAQAADYVNHFSELLIQAVKDRLRTDQVGVSMSGGLDSVSVAAVAKSLLSERSSDFHLGAVSVVYDRLFPDEERHYSSLAAEALEIPIEHVAADDFALYEERSGFDLQKPEPFHVEPTSALFREILVRLAKKGRVALGGWDGDAFMQELPNPHFAMRFKRAQFGHLYKDVRWFISSQRRLPPVGFRTLLKRLAGKHPPMPFYPKWLEASFAQRLKLSDRFQQFTSKQPTAHPTRPSAFSSLNSTSWAHLFESYDPGVTRLALEMRHPLIDVRLVEYLLAVPPVPWFVNKELLRAAMREKLPHALVVRPKVPLGGDPALRFVQNNGVEYLDGFAPTSKLRKYVNVNVCPKLAGEQKSDRLWANLRPFGLNYWLVNSQIIPRTEERDERQLTNPHFAERKPGEEDLSGSKTFYVR